MYQNYLNAENAQKIADEIMKIVPHNINITDTKGIILASGERDSVGTVLKSALTALQKKESYFVYMDTESEKQGVNLPILYNNQMIGVICIAGRVDEVLMIGQICMSITLLMLENQLLNDMSSIKESRLKDFLFEWISRTEDEYDEAFWDQAVYLNVDLTVPRTAVVITSSRIRYSVIENIRKYLTGSEYIVRQGMDEVLILFRTEKRLRLRLEKIMEISSDLKQCFIGESDIVAGRTVNSVMKTAKIAGMLQINKQFLGYDEVVLECLLSEVPNTSKVNGIIQTLEEKDADGGLKETIIAYAESNDNTALVCEKLHVHRNTLNYRLSRIEELMACNPRRIKDMMLLYIAVIKMGDVREN